MNNRAIFHPRVLLQQTEQNRSKVTQGRDNPYLIWGHSQFVRGRLYPRTEISVSCKKKKRSRDFFFLGQEINNEAFEFVNEEKKITRMIYAAAFSFLSRIFFFLL